MSKLMFSESFINDVSTYLEDKTKDGRCVTRGQLCTDLNVDKELGQTISTMLKLNYVPGYRVYMGPNGGIGRSDTKPPKKERSATSTQSAIALTDEEFQRIGDKIEELCVDGKVVSREVIATALGDASIKMQNTISLALKRPELSNFSTKKGKGGGVFKMLVKTGASVDTTVSSDVSEEKTWAKDPQSWEEDDTTTSKEDNFSNPDDKVTMVASAANFGGRYASLERQWARNAADLEAKS